MSIVRRILEDGRIIELRPMLFGNTRLTITHPEFDGLPFDAAWCYQLTDDGIAAAMQWDGEGDPPRWYRNLQTGEKREEYSRERSRVEGV